MEFSVTRISRGLVTPSGSTPSGVVLELSVIDKLPALRCNARTLHVFRHGPSTGAAKVIREALSDALIPYYPLAGRLQVSTKNDGQLQIACTGQGIWFVEALADCTLDAFNFFDGDVSYEYNKLLPDHIPPQSQENIDDVPPPLVQIQVTQFRCNGFVIGLVFCHSICDGLGAAQFLKAVAELAKSTTCHDQQLTTVTPKPQWCRDFLPASNSNPRTTNNNKPHIINVPDNVHQQLQNATVDISVEKINQIKQEFKELTGGRTCSTFEIVAASLWMQRTRAINLKDDDTQVKLVFFANCRNLLVDPPLPQGFYGNCFFPVTVTVKSGTLTKQEAISSIALNQVVKLIQEAKAGLADEFTKWQLQLKNDNDSGCRSDSDPFAPPLEYTTLFISEWSRLGFNEVDYGWGTPVHVVPIQGSSIIPVAILCSLPSPRKGIRLMTWCVNHAHLQSFIQHMKALFHIS